MGAIVVKVQLLYQFQRTYPVEETYIYPSLQKCATYSVFQDAKNTVFYVGCAVVGNGCQSLQDCNPDYHDFYTTRVTGPAETSFHSVITGEKMKIESNFK